MSSQQYCEISARRLNGTVRPDIIDGRQAYRIDCVLCGKPYWTYRYSWMELASAVHVMLDVNEQPTQA